MTIIDGKIFMDILQRLRNGICDDRCKSMTARGGCDCVIAAEEIERLRGEVELWKDRCEAERQAHEATIQHADDLERDKSYR